MYKTVFNYIFKGLGALIFLLLGLVVASYMYFKPTKTPVWGINFSPDQARYMGYDAQKVFLDLSRELKPKKIRLVNYWENIEKEKGVYDFSETDSLLKTAENQGIKITLVLGHKQPRWPECHHPNWYESLSFLEKKEALLLFIKKTVDRYKNHTAVERWQVENEPFFNYGKDCPVLAIEDLKEETDFVRFLDSRPIVTTDSGEKGGWFSAYQAGDVFGSTMYRKVHNPKWGGYITYPLPPAWYRVRAGFMHLLFEKKPVIGIELQAEPWFNGNVHEISLQEQLKIFTVEDFDKNIYYAKRTGLPEHFFWGVEWWYFMKERGETGYWEKAKVLMNKN